MIRVLLLDVYGERIKVEDIDPDDMNVLYELIDCSCIDIVTRKIGGRTFDIVCDDEGLFHEPQKISAIDGNGQPMLVGNLIFCHHDEAGNLTSITAEDELLLTDHLLHVFTNQFPTGYRAIGGLGWR